MSEEIAEWIEETETGIKRQVRIVSRNTPEGAEIEINNHYSGEGVTSKAQIADVDKLKDALDQLN